MACQGGAQRRTLPTAALGGGARRNEGLAWAAGPGHSEYPVGRVSQRDRSRRAPEPSMELAEAIADVMDILRGGPAAVAPTTGSA